jgi:hypothetical protein
MAELERFRKDLKTAEVLNQQLRRLLEARDAEIFRLRELIAKREKRKVAR